VGRYAIIDPIYRISICYELLKDFYDDIGPTSRAVSVFGRKRKRSAVWREQNMAVCGMCDPL